MNSLINNIENWYKELPRKIKLGLDLFTHYFIAYWILLILGALTIYLGSITSELFVYSAVLALPMLPLRILILRYLESCKQEDYLNQVLEEILHNDQQSSDQTNGDGDDDDDDWFMKIAKG